MTSKQFSRKKYRFKARLDKVTRAVDRFRAMDRNRSAVTADHAWLIAAQIQMCGGALNLLYQQGVLVDMQRRTHEELRMWGDMLELYSTQLRAMGDDHGWPTSATPLYINPHVPVLAQDEDAVTTVLREMLK